jgi:hypothetical protein
MKKLLLIVVACLFASGMAFAQDPGNQDSVIVSTTLVPQGTQTIDVWFFCRTDDSIAFYNMPIVIEYSGTGISIDHIAYYPPLTFWDDTFDSLVVSQGFYRMLGFYDIGGEDNPPLFTNYNRVQPWKFVFTAEPGAPSQVVTIDTTTDPVNGSIMFGVVGGSIEIHPAFVPGGILYGTLDVDDETAEIPTEFALNQNYPNPFNPQTNVSFDLPKSQYVSLEIYNILGQQVKTLASGNFEAGRYAYTWNGTNSRGEDVPSGIYFYSLKTEEFSKTNKMMLIR